MKGKIMMMALLCALLVGLVPPSGAHAEEVDENYESVVAYIKELGETMYLFPSESHYVVYEDASGTIYFIGVTDSLPYYRLWNGEDKLFLTYGHNLTGYSLADGVWTKSSTLDCYSHKDEHRINFARILASSCDIIDYKTGAVFFDCNPGYSFGSWCTDAGLNYAPSSNDLGLIKYGYEGYMHIVRRTGLDKYGRWVLTTIGNSVYADNTEDFTVMVDENGQLGVYCLYSGEEEGGYQLFVRNYVYDTDGWRLMSYELFDVREDDDCIIELGEDSSIDDYSLLAYSNVDIYSSGLNLTYPASTEFVDVNDVLPDVPEQPEEPSVTPTSTPSNPSGGSGAEGGGVGGGTRPEGGADDAESWLDKIQGTLNDIKDMFSQDESVNGSVSELTSTLKDMFGVVSVVPLMIGAVFGFLPSWCLVIVGASFAFMAIYLVVKLIRG